MNRAAAVSALVLVAAAGGVTWRWLADREPAPVTAPSPVAPVVAPASAPEPAQAAIPAPAAPKPKPAPVATAGSVRYPDGSKQPALNGVQTDLVIEWGVRPFTPIVGIEDGPGGWKWYVHENGTRSTTAMVADKDGVLQAHAVVAEPEAPLPLAPGPEGPKSGGARPGGQK